MSSVAGVESKPRGEFITPRLYHGHFWNGVTHWNINVRRQNKTRENRRCKLRSVRVINILTNNYIGPANNETKARDRRRHRGAKGHVTDNSTLPDSGYTFLINSFVLCDTGNYTGRVGGFYFEASREFS